MKAVIGIVPTCNLFRNDNPYDDKYTFINNYSKRIIDNNGIPIGLLLNDGKANLDVLNVCDGFLFPGGKKLERIHFEILLYAINNNKPVLGICLGMQVMAYFGILYDILKLRNIDITVDNLFKVYNENKEVFQMSDISEGIHGYKIMKEIVNCNQESLEDSKHDIAVFKDSILYDVYKKENLNVYSMHSKAISKYGSIFNVSAKAPDGVIEALEYYNKNYFIIGVQYHPELNNDELFKRLIKEAGDRHV